jgi:hypothetical protein
MPPAAVSAAARRGQPALIAQTRIAASAVDALELNPRAADRTAIDGDSVRSKETACLFITALPCRCKKTSSVNGVGPSQGLIWIK